MHYIDHIKISRLMDAAIGRVNLTDSELDHNVQCDACQDLLEIFTKELPGPLPSDVKETVRKISAA
jgi:hypothetical protein